MSGTCLVSCAMGSGISDVWDAPVSYDSYLYTNNNAIVETAVSKGWRVLRLDVELSSDLVVSSVQSKYVKFIQFLDDFAEIFSVYDQVMYVDHKFRVQDSHIRSLLSLKQRPILIRKTPRLKESIWHEFRVAMRQPRYRKFRARTLEYIGEKLDQGCHDAMRICNTGLIIYQLSDQRVRLLASSVYSDICRVGSPECQIVWAMVSQQYPDIVQVIDFDAVPIEWKAPKRAPSLNPPGDHDQ